MSERPYKAPLWLSVLRRVRRIGVDDSQPSSLKRQIALTNQMSFLGLLLTLPYQLFYLLHDGSRYLEILIVNAVFMLTYLVPLMLNAGRRAGLASELVLVLACLHVWIDTSLISTASGTHLLFIGLGGVLGLMFSKRRQGPLLLIALVLVGLFVAAHLLFPRGSTAIEIPSPYVEIMFALTVLATITLLTGFPYTFRREIERSEARHRRIAEELQRLSLTDELTRLPNRRAHEQLLAVEWGRALRYRHSLAVLMVDVDHFKAFNDHYGHAAGDDCLRAVARVLKDCLKRDADHVARYGGEEFCMVLPDTDARGARRVSERILRGMAALAWPHAFTPVATHVTVSIGYAVRQVCPGEEMVVLRDQADAALYQAKVNGRARAVAFHQCDALNPSTVVPPP